MALLFFTLSLAFMTYVDKMSLNVYDEFCGNDIVNDAILNDKDTSFLESCLEQKATQRMKYGYKLLGLTLFIFLIILSWKVDRIKNE